jgi:hypothetical protein
MTSIRKQEEDYLKTNPKPEPDFSWTEPASDWDSKPPLNKVIGSESGHSIELDDTPGAERVRIQHRTGSFTEIQSNGQEIHKIVGDSYEIIAGDNNVLIKGVCNITVEGTSILHVKGDAYAQVDGKSWIKNKGDVEVSAEKNVDVRCGGDINLFAGAIDGGVNIYSPVAVNINSDLNVAGTITAKQSISSVQNVTAGMKLFSNLGVETLGPITSAISVWSPLTSGLIVTDVRGSMELIRMMYNIHVHPRTGTPIPLM